MPVRAMHLGSSSGSRTSSILQQHQPLLQRHGRGPVEGVARANGDVQEPLALLRQPVVGRVQHAVMHEEAERLERRADVPVGAPVVPGEQARHVLQHDADPRRARAQQPHGLVEQLRPAPVLGAPLQPGATEGDAREPGAHVIAS